VRRAFAKSPQDAAAVTAAEAANMAWSQIVGRGTTLTISLIVALALGDEDDVKEAFRRAFDKKQILIQLAVDIFNLIDPLVTPKLLESLAYNQAGVFDTAVGSSVNDLVDGVGDLVESALALSDGDAETAAMELITGISKIGLEVTALAGIDPLDTVIRRIIRSVDKLDENESEKAVAR
jgi:hypothetical protein